MKPQHTPGPWHVGFNPGPIVYGEKGEQVANLFVPMVPLDENKANAQLIAAAPDLLAALEVLIRDSSQAWEKHSERLSGDCFTLPFSIDLARKALAKAKGEV